MDLSDSQLEALCALLEEDQPATIEALDRQISSMDDDILARLFDRLAINEGRKVLVPPSLLEYHHTCLERRFSEWAVAATEGGAVGGRDAPLGLVRLSAR